MKKLFNISVVFLGLMFLMVSCNDSISSTDEVEQNIVEVELRRGGWGAVWADVSGGWSRGGMGAKIGGMFGPNGAVIGGMLGAVGGAAAGSISYANECARLKLPNNEKEWNTIDVLDVPNNSRSKVFNEVGILHNLIMFDLIKENHENGDFEHFYNVFEKHIISRKSFNLTSLPNGFKDELSILYNDIIQSNSTPSEVNDLIDYFGNLESNFDLKIDKRLVETNSQRELNALSVLIYTKHFWSNFE